MKHIFGNMGAKTKQFEIKLPSNPTSVNPDSLWKFVETISKTGDTFTKEQLIQQGLFTKSMDAIKRNLAYLKYLGIIEESREKIGNGDKKDNIQKFKLVKSQIVGDLTYDLQAGRVDSAKENWHSILMEHDLFKALQTIFFEDGKTKTLIDLEHFLRQEIPDKSHTHYQTGGNFIIELLREANLISKNGERIALVNFEREENSVEEEATRNESKDQDDSIDEKSKKIENYIITIKGPHMDTSIEITDCMKLEIVDSVLVMIRAGLKDDCHDGE